MPNAFQRARGLAIATVLLALIGTGAYAQDDPIAVGTVFNMTGAQAVLDVPASNGAELAFGDINRAGGVRGRPLVRVGVDGDSQPTNVGARTAAMLAANPGITAVIGLSDTDSVLAAAGAAAQAGRLFLTSGATSPKLPGQIPGDLFLAAFGDNVQAAAAAEWAHGELGARRAAVIYDDNETFTRLLQGYFAERFAAVGGTITATHKVDPRADGFAAPDPGAVDLVFLGVVTAEDAVRAIAALRAGGYTGPVFGGDGWDAAAVWQKHPEIGGAYFTTHVYLGADSPNPRARRFLDAYTAAYPGEAPGAFAALAYDAVGLIAAAIAATGATAPGDIARGLERMGAYQGVTGAIRYDGGSHIPRKSVTVMRVGAGKQSFAAEVVPIAVPAP